jgi:hypothetical protein
MAEESIKRGEQYCEFNVVMVREGKERKRGGGVEI